MSSRSLKTSLFVLTEDVLPRHGCLSHHLRLMLRRLWRSSVGAKTRPLRSEKALLTGTRSVITLLVLFHGREAAVFQVARDVVSRLCRRTFLGWRRRSTLVFWLCRRSFLRLRRWLLPGPMMLCIFRG